MSHYSNMPHDLGGEYVQPHMVVTGLMAAPLPNGKPDLVGAFYMGLNVNGMTAEDDEIAMTVALTPAQAIAFYADGLRTTMDAIRNARNAGNPLDSLPNSIVRLAEAETDELAEWTGRVLDALVRHAGRRCQHDGPGAF